MSGSGAGAGEAIPSPTVTERFLAQVARAGGDEALTDALAAWTATLWPSAASEPGQPPPAFYLDGHKKPVYTDHLIPRGLIGRTGKILGCRALLLLHDAQGHPLFATTHRGDLHLTKGASAFLERYEQATESSTLTRLIIAPPSATFLKCDNKRDGGDG